MVEANRGDCSGLHLLDDVRWTQSPTNMAFNNRVVHLLFLKSEKADHSNNIHEGWINVGVDRGCIKDSVGVVNETLLRDHLLVYLNSLSERADLRRGVETYLVAAVLEDLSCLESYCAFAIGPCNMDAS